MSVLHKARLVGVAVSLLWAATSFGQDAKEEALHGEWEMVGMVEKGKVARPNEIDIPGIRISASRLLFLDKERDRLPYKLVIRAAKEPKEIDLETGWDVYRGIYDLKDGALRLAFRWKPDGDRPTGFDAEKDKGLTLYILKKSSKEALYGEWELVRLVDKGLAAPAEEIEGHGIRIAKVGLEFLGKKRDAPALSHRIVIRSLREPKEIDLEIQSNLFRGIYDLKDGTLRLVFARKPDGDRPTGFNAEKDKGLTLYTLKKPKM